MCCFKSGIILKNRCIMSQEHEESHFELLKNLGIDDTAENAMRVFVRAELVPQDGKWWTDPSEWEFRVDQDMVPEWYADDQKRYEQEFREEVKRWTDEHVIVAKKMDKLPEGYYFLKDCNIRNISGKSQINMIDTIIGTIKNESVIFSMNGNSSIKMMDNVSFVVEANDNAVIQKMCAHAGIYSLNMKSTVEEMLGTSFIYNMKDNSVVYRMREQTIVYGMYCNSKIRKMYNQSFIISMNGNAAIVEMMDDSSVINFRDNATIKEMKDNTTVKNAFDKTVIKEMRDYSIVQQLHDLSTVKKLYGDAIARKINICEGSKILTSDNSIVHSVNNDVVVPDYHENSLM